MLENMKWNMDYSCVFQLQTTKNYCLSALKQRIFVLPEITTENRRQRKVQLTLYIDNPQITALSHFLQTNHYQL